MKTEVMILNESDALEFLKYLEGETFEDKDLKGETFEGEELENETLEVFEDFEPITSHSEAKKLHRMNRKEGFRKHHGTAHASKGHMWQRSWRLYNHQSLEERAKKARAKDFRFQMMEAENPVEPATVEPVGTHENPAVPGETVQADFDETEEYLIGLASDIDSVMKLDLVKKTLKKDLYERIFREEPQSLAEYNFIIALCNAISSVD